MRLNLLYQHSPHLGYGYLGQELDKALRRLGVDVFDGMPIEGDTPGTDFNGERRAACHDVCFVTLPGFVPGWWEGQRPMIFTMFEATEIPDIFRCNLDQYDTVFVPSKQNVRMFGEYHPNVKHVPLGIDSEVWYYQRRQPPKMWFNFLHPAMGPRKGVDASLAAFDLAFPRNKWESMDPLPRLVFKTPRVNAYDAVPSDRVQVFTGRLSIEDEVAVYADAHCVLAPSRGEGWGMQPLQAIAQGCPTILTDAHGHAEFSHLGIGIGWDFMPAHYSLFGDCGFHWDPSVDDLADSMRWVYDNYDEACADAMANSEEAHAEFTWRNSAEAFLRGAKLHPNPHNFDPVTWRPSDHRVEMVTTQDLTPSIGGIDYTFKRGETYLVPPDVKRVITNAGYVEKVPA